MVKLFRGLNLFFQPAQTGFPLEYRNIDITLDERVMEDINNWILDLVH